MATDVDSSTEEEAEISTLRGRVARAFRGRFMRRAAQPDAEDEVQGSLDAKLASIGSSGRGQREEKVRERLRKLVAEALEIWEHRGKLSREDYLLIVAALLYFISPLDAVPDVIPVVGYLDDIAVLAAVVAKLAKVVLPRAERWAHDFVQENVDEALAKIDRTSEEALGRTVTGISISLWSATNVAAVSLLVAAAGNGEVPMWRTYVVVCGGMVLFWNAIVAFQFWHLVRNTDGVWQRRIVAAVASKLGVGHAFQIGIPVVLLAGLGAMRMFAS